MGMSTHIIGIKPPDKKWRKMKGVWDACVEAGVNVPAEVNKFFEGFPPDSAGVHVNIDQAVEKYSEYAQEGYEVYINSLPENVSVIRFFNSW